MPGCLVAIAGMCLYLALLVQAPIPTLVATGMLALAAALLLQLRLWRASSADGSRSPRRRSVSGAGPKPG